MVALKSKVRWSLPIFEEDQAHMANTEHLCCSAVAALTTKIKAMAEHMRVHRKDYHSRRGLEAMLNQRKSLLQYLRRKDFDSYAIVLSRLGLRDNYMKLVCPSCLSRMQLAHPSICSVLHKTCQQHALCCQHKGPRLLLPCTVSHLTIC